MRQLLEALDGETYSFRCSLFNAIHCSMLHVQYVTANVLGIREARKLPSSSLSSFFHLVSDH